VADDHKSGVGVHPDLSDSLKTRIERDEEHCEVMFYVNIIRE
jgi:hypothetical protein